jgi:hypothetical protein
MTYLKTLGLSDVDLARATGTAAERDARVGELAETAGRLERLIDRELVVVWLRTSIPELGWATPLDLIGRGDAALVGQVVADLEEREEPG